ncbi:MAG: hypothetical protein HY677_01695, partial [Chloroflexi bacterium]|nr:hypothetical protein [Chloroflexota bacterium]
VLWRRHTKTFRVVSNVFIAGGAILSSTTGLSRIGIAGGLYLGLFLGVILIFIGFLISIEVFEQFRVPFTNVVLRARQQGERAP